MIKAILFDLGQTLLHFGSLRSGAIFSQAAANAYSYLMEQGQPVPNFFRYRLVHIMGLRWHLLVSALTGNDFDSMRLLKHYGQKHGFNLTESQWQDLNWRWYQPLVKLAALEPGLTETLRALKAMNLKLGIVSNTFVNASSLDRHLEQLGLLEFFPVRLYSCHLPWRKPDVRIFALAARQIGVEPDRILFVGDKPGTDIRGALRAGMQPVLIKNSAGGKHPRNIPVIDTIAQLAALVERLNSSLHGQSQ